LSVTLIVEKNANVSGTHKSAENHIWYLIQRHVISDVIETRGLDVWQRSKIPVGLFMTTHSRECNAERRVAKFIVKCVMQGIRASPYTVSISYSMSCNTRGNKSEKNFDAKYHRILVYKKISSILLLKNTFLCLYRVVFHNFLFISTLKYLSIYISNYKIKFQTSWLHSFKKIADVSLVFYSRIKNIGPQLRVRCCYKLPFYNKSPRRFRHLRAYATCWRRGTVCIVKAAGESQGQFVDWFPFGFIVCDEVTPKYPGVPSLARRTTSGNRSGTNPDAALRPVKTTGMAWTMLGNQDYGERQSIAPVCCVA